MKLALYEKKIKSTYELKTKELIKNLDETIDSLHKNEGFHFPYPSLYNLVAHIELISNNELRSYLLNELNSQVIGRLFQYNPKLFPLWQRINELTQEITEYQSDEATTDIDSPSL